jgi:hypothetical protein
LLCGETLLWETMLCEELSSPSGKLEDLSLPPSLIESDFVLLITPIPMDTEEDESEDIKNKFEVEAFYDFINRSENPDEIFVLLNNQTTTNNFTAHLCRALYKRTYEVRYNVPTTFSPEEDLRLMLAIIEHENRWKLVAPLLGRTINSVRNRWQRVQDPTGGKNLCQVCGQLQKTHTCFQM